MNQAPESILIVCIRLIGDVILTTPLVGLLKEAYPDAAIDLLVLKGTGEFLEKDPRIRQVLYSEKRGKGYLRDIFRRYDMAINMNASDRGSIACVLAGRRFRIGFRQGKSVLKNFWKRLFFTHLMEFPFSIHVARLSQLVAEGLGITVSRLEARVFWDSNDAQLVENLLKANSIGSRYFVLHPFARWQYKYWRPERFAAVSDAVVERYGWQPVWTSSPASEEQRLLVEAAGYCQHRPTLVAGDFTINQMACLLAGARLFVGLDTAISHIAATVKIPMVALYGPTIAERWSPWNNLGPVAQQCPLPCGVQQAGAMILIQKDWPCIPCGMAGCDDRGGESPCLLEIEVPEVLAAVEKVLASYGADAHAC